MDSMGNRRQSPRPRFGPGRPAARMAIALTLVCLCLGSVPAKPNRINHTRMRDIAYQPFLKKDGYVQAWNINFHGNGYSIFLTYLISNMGPGRLNNGLSMVIRQGKKTRVGTAEFAERSLKARRGRLDVKMGSHNSLVYRKGAYHIGAKVNETSLKLTLRPGGPGLRLSGGPIRVGGARGDFIRADVPVVAGWARGVLTIDGKRIALSGAAGMEHILANRSPHKYANRFTLVRTVRGNKAVLLGGIHKTSGGFALNAAYMEKGRVVRAGSITKYKVLKARKDDFSGYRIPLKSVYYLSGPGEIVDRLQGNAITGEVVLACF